MVDLTTDEVNRTELPRQAVSQEDLTKYLDTVKVKSRADKQAQPTPSKLQSLSPETMVNKLYKGDQDKEDN